MTAKLTYTSREMAIAGLLIAALTIGLMAGNFEPENFVICLFFISCAGIAGFRRAEKESPSPWRVINMLMTGGGLLLIFFLVFAPCSGHRSREKARRISCASNLKQIGLALKQYAQDYKDYFPDKDAAAGFEILRKEEYLNDYKIYVCPSTRNVAASGQQPVITDYEYRGGLKDTAENADQPLAWDKIGNHKEFVNVLFCGGHILGMQQKEFDALRKKYNLPPTNP